MNNIDKLRGRISSLIKKEIDHTKSELSSLRQKQQSNMSYYGLGGPYQRYEKAIKRRQNYLTELEAVQKAQGCAVILEKLQMYGYFCAKCQEQIYLTCKSPEIVECPLCGRRIYRTGMYTEWKVEKDNRFTRLH